MTKRLKLKYILILAAVLAAFLLGRSTGSTEQQTTQDPSTSEANAPSSWTCPMHPQVQQPEFGTCPLCGMDLVPVQTGDSSLGPTELELSEHAMALAEVETALVERKFVTRSIFMTGKIAFDDTLRRDVSLLTDGLVEKLFVNYEGVAVREGEHLAELYSPEVYTAFREMLVAAANNANPRTVEAAKTKLLLYGVSEKQIEDVLESKTAPRTFTVYSPIDGVLTRKQGNQGQWLREGMTLGEVTDVSRVWAQLDAYESDIGIIHYGQQVELEVEALPGKPLTGFVSFIPPELNEATRSIKIRLNVPNPGGKLKPGMFVKATLKTTAVSDGMEIAPDMAGKWISPMHPEVVKDEPGSCDVCGMALVPAEQLGFILSEQANTTPPLIIPTTAPLITGKRAVVYVQDPETPTRFEGRTIRLGAKADGVYLVEDGLKEGERVVTHGAMKIDSTLQIQAKPGMMSAPSESSTTPTVPDNWDNVIQNYLRLQNALGMDNSENASKAATDLAAIKSASLSPLSKTLSRIAEATDIEAQRELFLTLSNRMIALIETHGPGSSTVYKAYCPMAFDDNGAAWLQDAEELLNPYFGDAMLRCGVIQETYTP